MPKNRINKRADGRYNYKATDASGRRFVITSKKGENKRDFSKRCDQLDEKAAGDIALIALDDLFYLWLKKYVAVKRSNAYYDSMIGVYETHIKNSLGKKRIEDIKRSDVYKLLATVEKEGASASLVSKTRTCISAPYNWAINALGMQIISPTNGLIYKVETKKAGRTHKPLTDEELSRFFNVSDHTKYKNYYRLLLLTGLRPSEALGLKISDIKSDKLLIRRAITSKDQSSLKTSAARRDIPITPDIRSILLDQVEQSKFITKDGWLFPSGGGMPSMVALKSSFIKSVKATADYQRGGRNGLKKIAILQSPVKITLYDFRHTFATRMAQHGTNPKILQYLMGHESIETTLDFYVDFTHEMVGEAIGQMGKICTQFAPNRNENSFKILKLG